MNIFGNRRKADDKPAESPATITTEAPTPATISPQVYPFETVLGVSTVIKGSLSCKGNIRLDGQFTGTLDITGNVLVGEQAVIKADIDANNVSIAGEVHGNVTGKRVQILQSGRVWGDINAESLATDDGAIIDGKVSMQPKTEIVDDLDGPTIVVNAPTAVLKDNGDVEEVDETSDD